MSSPGVQFFDRGYPTQVTVGGVTMYGVVEGDTTSAQNAPTKPAEAGFDFTSRSTVKPDEGTLTGWMEQSDLTRFITLVQRRQPVEIVSTERSYPRCIVQNVKRNTSGEHIDAYNVTIEWREVLTAETSSSPVKAVTDGKKTSGSGEEGGMDVDFVQGNEESSNDNANQTQNTNDDGGVVDQATDWVSDTTDSVLNAVGL